MHSRQRIASLTAAAEHYRHQMGTQCADHLDARGIPLAVAHRFGLGEVDADCLAEHRPYIGMLSIPYRTPAGVVGFKFRRITGEGPKYLSPAGQRIRMFNTDDLLDAGDTIVICEGELDAVVMSGVVGVPAVGVAGVQAWMRHHPRMFAGFSQVLVATDNDAKTDGSNPGQDLARRIVADVEQATIVTLPVGMDVSETVVSSGIAHMRSLLGVSVELQAV